MPDYPTIEKSWNYNVNQTLLPQGSAQSCAQNLLYQTVQSMLGFGGSSPWVCRGSSDGTHYSLPVQSASAGTNYWTSPSAIVAGTPSTSHSWIVLRQSALGPGYPEILISLSNSGSYLSAFVWISPSVGFSGGSSTTDPTAPDMIQLQAGGVPNIGWGAYNANVQYALHAEMSNDGECTRIWVFYGGSFQSMWIIDRVKNPVSGWKSPWVMDTEYLSPTINGVWNDTSQTYGGFTQIGQNGVPVYQSFAFFWTCEGSSSNNVPSLYDAPNELSGEWPMCPIGLQTNVAYHVPHGRHGMFYDLWLGCSAVPTGQLYAGASAHAYVQIGQYILPWSGAAAMNMT